MCSPIFVDAALLVAEDFLDDIEWVVRASFEKAEHDEELKGNIMKYLSDGFPILV